MGKQEDITDRERQFAKIWADSRVDAGKTQDYMAKGLGVSKKTIQNWENDVRKPADYIVRWLLRDIEDFKKRG